MAQVGQHPLNDALNRVLINLHPRLTPVHLSQLISQGIDTSSSIPPSFGAVPLSECTDHFNNQCDKCRKDFEILGKISASCHLKNIVGRGARADFTWGVSIISRAEDILQIISTFGQEAIIRMFRGLLLLQKPGAVDVLRSIEDNELREKSWDAYLVNSGKEALNKIGEFIIGTLKVRALSHKHRPRTNKSRPFSAGISEGTGRVLQRLNKSKDVDAVWVDVVYSRFHRSPWGPECILPYILFQTVCEEDEDEADVRNSTWMQVERICSQQAALVGPQAERVMQNRALAALVLVARLINLGALSHTNCSYPEDKIRIETWARTDFYNIILGWASYDRSSTSEENTVSSLKPRDLLRWMVSVTGSGNLAEQLMASGGATSANHDSDTKFAGLLSYVDDTVCAEVGMDRLFQAEILRCLQSYWLISHDGATAHIFFAFAPGSVMRHVIVLTLLNSKWVGSVLFGDVVSRRTEMSDYKITAAVRMCLDILRKQAKCAPDYLYFMRERIEVSIDGEDHILIPERLSRVRG